MPLTLNPTSSPAKLQNQKKWGIDAPWLVLGAILIATFVSAWQSGQREKEDASVRFAERATGLTQAFTDRLNRIEHRLRGASGVVIASERATAVAWNIYFDTARDTDGLLSVSYLPKSLVPNQRVASEGKLVRHLIQAVPKEALTPEAAPEIVEMLDGSTSSDGWLVSPPIARLDDASVSSGLIAVIVPVRTPSTNAAAGANPLAGWVVGFFSLPELALRSAGANQQLLTMGLQDEDRILFATPSFAETRKTAQFNAVEKVAAGPRAWQLFVTSTPELEKQFSSRTPQVIFSIGILGTLLMGVLIWLMSRLRQQAEAMAAGMTVQLRDQVKFTEDLIEFNPNPIFRKDADGRYVAVNRAWELLTGHRRADILGKVSHDILPPEIARNDVTQDQSLLQSASGTTVSEVLINNQHQRFETIIAKQVLRTSTGEVDGLIGTITDVTEIKTLERELARQREQLDMVISSSQQGIYDLSLDGGQEQYFSARFREMLGHNSVSFPREFRWQDCIHPEDHALFVSELVRHFKRKSALFDVELRAKRRDETYVWVRVRALAQFRADGRATRFVGSIVDIADRKEAESTLLEANARVTEAARAKEAFLATMSHEIRTPLNGVLGMAGLLSETRLNEEQRDYIRLIKASGDTLLRLIDDVLDFSKIESGRMPLESIPVEFVPLIEEVFDLVAERAREKRLFLTYDARDDVPFYVMGDATRIRQILLNLVSNAVKFTQVGGIHTQFSARRLADGRLELSCAVKDTGIGIAEESLQQLFQPFTQADASTTRKYGGTGLGLVIVKRLAEMMGGGVKVESKEGAGSTFTFTIITQAARGPLKPYMQRDVFDFIGKRLLVIDATAERRAIAAYRFARWGLNTTVSEPQKAVSALESADYDILLTDFAVPGEEASALQTALLKNDAHRATRGERPIVSILVSAYSRVELAERGIAPPIRHDLLVFRPVGQARLFDVTMRAALREFAVDEFFRPYDPERDAVQRMRPDATGVQSVITSVSPAVAEGATHAGAFETSLHVLVAEDNEVNQRVISGMLTNLGHRITLVSDGRAAVNQAKKMRFDVILMDIHMPELDGVGAMHEIRDALGSRCPPIAAMTAHAMPGDREGYLAAGMNDYIAKPLRMVELSNLFIRLSSQMIDRVTEDDGVAAQATKAAQATRNAEILAATPPPASAVPAIQTVPDWRALPVLDLDQLEDLRYLPAASGGEDPVTGLIELFRSKAQERIGIIEECLGTSDWLRLAETAHSLRGASASMGFPRVAAVCKSLELGGRRLLPNDPKLVMLGLHDTPPPTQAELDELFEIMRLNYREADTALAKWLATPVAAPTP